MSKCAQKYLDVVILLYAVVKGVTAVATKTYWRRQVFTRLWRMAATFLQKRMNNCFIIRGGNFMRKPCFLRYGCFSWSHVESKSLKAIRLQSTASWGFQWYKSSRDWSIEQKRGYFIRFWNEQIWKYSMIGRLFGIYLFWKPLRVRRFGTPSVAQ